MRTRPIEIRFGAPTKEYESITIFAPSEKCRPIFEKRGYKNITLVSMTSNVCVDKMSIERHAKSKVLYVFLKNWVHERELLTVLLDTLEQTNGAEFVFIEHSDIAESVFGHVVIEDESDATASKEFPPNPDDASTDVPNDIGGLLDEFLDEYDILDERNESESLEVGPDGTVLFNGKVVGDIKDAGLVYGRPSYVANGLVVSIEYDRLYNPNIEDYAFRCKHAGLSGSGTDGVFSMYMDLTQLPRGAYKIAYFVTGSNPRAYHIFEKSNHLVSYYTYGQPGKIRVAKSSMFVEEGNVLYSRVLGVPVCSSIGLLFARCAARDYRRVFDINAFFYYEGVRLPIEYDAEALSLRVGSLVINHSNFEKFM